MWKGRFSQDMNDIVCRFTQSLDLDWRTARDDIRGSVAHVRMLAKIGLLKDDEATAIERELRKIAEEVENGTFIPKESLEDVHMNVESLLIERLGDVGGKIHTGRSRNDQSNTSVRLALRREILGLWDMLKPLLETLLDRAREHAGIPVPGYTHLQQAQPVSMGHFWMAHFQAFARDARLLLNAYELADECPLGCGALAGSTIPLDREMTARDLGFSRIAENSMDAVAGRDHIIAFHYFSSLFAVHVSRICEDLIVYFTSEFGWVTLPDEFCTGSSMMPQKKNPDVLELLRGKAGGLISGLVDTLILVKGTPLTFNRDFQEDKRALWKSVDTLCGMLEVLPPLLAGVGVDEEAASRGFADGFIYATDIAEHLVKRGVPFRTSHEIVGNAVLWCIREKRSFLSLTRDEWKKLMPLAADDLPEQLFPGKSIANRDTYGGTSPRQVWLQIERGAKRVEEIDAEFSGYRKCFPTM